MTEIATREYAVRICDACYEMKGEMCHTPECAFCRRTMAEVREYLSVTLIRPIVDGESLDLHPLPICPDTGDDVDECHCVDVLDYDQDDEADLRRKCEQEGE